MSWPVCAAASKAASKIEGRGGDGGNAALAVSTDCNFEFPCIAEHSEYCPETARTYRRAHASTHAHTRLLLFSRRLQRYPTAARVSHGGTGIPSISVRLGRYLMLTVAAIAAAALIAGGGALIFHCLPSAAWPRCLRTAGPSVARRLGALWSALKPPAGGLVWSGLARSLRADRHDAGDRASRPRADRPIDHATDSASAVGRDRRPRSASGAPRSADGRRLRS